MLATGSFANDGTITLENGATLLDTSFDFSNTGSIVGAGNIEASFNGTGSLVGTGQLEAIGGTLVVNAATVASGVALQAGENATLALNAAYAGGFTYQTIDATLQLDQPASFTGTLANVGNADTLVLSGVTATGVLLNDGTLTVNVSGGGTPESFVVTSGSAHGAILTNPGTSGAIIAFTNDELVTWTHQGSGLWSTKGDWSPAIVPDSSTIEAFLQAVTNTPSYTVTLAAATSFTIDALFVQTGGASLDILRARFLRPDPAAQRRPAASRLPPAPRSKAPACGWAAAVRSR